MASKFSIEAIFKAVDKITAPVTRMQNRVGKATRSMKNGFDDVNKSVDRVTGSIKSGASAAAKTIGLSTAALGTVVTLVNRASVESEMLAESVGISVDKLEAITAAVAPAGFELNHVVDLVEELNNKIGESAGLKDVITPVKEALAILGVAFEDVVKLSPEQQFEKITDAALGMADAQKAAAAMDILLGGEANKLTGILRQQGKSLDEITARYEALNFRTEASRQGARAFNDQISLITTGAGSLSAEISGLVGGHLVPLLKTLVEWTTANKALIATKVVQFITSIVDGIVWLIENGERVTKIFKVFVYTAGGLMAVSFALKAISVAMAAVNLAMSLNPIGMIVIALASLVAAISVAIVYWDEIEAKIASVALSIGVSISSMIASASAGLAGLGSAVKKVWNDILSFFAGVWGEIDSLFEKGVANILAIVDRVKNAAKGVAHFLTGGLFRSKVDVEAKAAELAPLPSVGAQAEKIIRTMPTQSAANDSERSPPARPQLVSPTETLAKTLIESRSKSTAELTIRDDTGRTKVTGGELPQGVKVINTGSFGNAMAR